MIRTTCSEMDKQVEKNVWIKREKASGECKSICRYLLMEPHGMHVLEIPNENGKRTVTTTTTTTTTTIIIIIITILLQI